MVVTGEDKEMSIGDIFAWVCILILLGFCLFMAIIVNSLWQHIIASLSFCYFGLIAYFWSKDIWGF